VLHLPAEDVALPVLNSRKLLDHIGLVVGMRHEHVGVRPHQHLRLDRVDFERIGQPLFEYFIGVFVSRRLVECVHHKCGPDQAELLEELDVETLAGVLGSVLDQAGVGVVERHDVANEFVALVDQRTEGLVVHSLFVELGVIVVPFKQRSPDECSLQSVAELVDDPLDHLQLLEFIPRHELLCFQQVHQLGSISLHVDHVESDFVLDVGLVVHVEGLV